jgi:hypothetical protein
MKSWNCRQYGLNEHLYLVHAFAIFVNNPFFMRVVPFIIPVFAALLACTPEDTCDDPTGSLLVARFKSPGPPVSDTIIPDITIFGIDESGSRGFLYDSVDVARAEFPLDAQRNSTRFVLKTNGGSDTLEIHHTSESYLVSYACGFALRYMVTGIGYHGQLIDSVQIIEPAVDAEMLTNEENIWIYF